MLQKFCAGYAAGSTSASRGDVVPAVLEQLSLPCVAPLPIEGMSERIKTLFSDWENHMLVKEEFLPDELPRIYEDPLFASKEGKLGLCQKLFQANMLRFVSATMKTLGHRTLRKCSTTLW